MTPLNFRVWVPKINRMFPVAILNLATSQVICLDDLRQKCVFNFCDCTLMQSTGLRDKNGKEIFEGDILEWEGMRSVIQWDNEGCFATTFADPGTILPHGEMIVVGNIYENPDLLPKA
jgi:uncharacterized phage protein (TIGR01671 family)